MPRIRNPEPKRVRGKTGRLDCNAHRILEVPTCICGRRWGSAPLVAIKHKESFVNGQFFLPTGGQLSALVSSTSRYPGAGRHPAHNHRGHLASADQRQSVQRTRTELLRRTQQRPRKKQSGQRTRMPRFRCSSGLDRVNALFVSYSQNRYS